MKRLGQAKNIPSHGRAICGEDRPLKKKKGEKNRKEKKKAYGNCRVQIQRDRASAVEQPPQITQFSCTTFCELWSRGSLARPYSNRPRPRTPVCPRIDLQIDFSPDNVAKIRLVVCFTIARPCREPHVQRPYPLLRPMICYAQYAKRLSEPGSLHQRFIQVEL